MRKVRIVVISVAFCLAVAFSFPYVGITFPTVDEGGCLDCHGANPFPDGTIHTMHSSVSCELCHNFVGVTPSSSKCIVCHPLGDPGQCNLVNFHDPDIGGDCLSCHTGCSADICEGDFDNDKDVDGDDVTKFLEDFGRSQYFNPCQ